jgi:hypothetical protein
MVQLKMITRTIYFKASLIFAISLAVSALPAVPDVIKNLLVVPAVGSLSLMLIELFRDQLAHERAVELQNKQQNFTLGVASKMAEIVFEKQVKFVEAYIEIVNEIVELMRGKGFTQEVMQPALKLGEIRKANTAWVSEQTDAQLEEFEYALRDLAGTVKMMDEGLSFESDALAIRKAAYTRWKQITGRSVPADGEPNVQFGYILKQIKHILKTDELVELRDIAIESATKRVRVESAPDPK